MYTFTQNKNDVANIALLRHIKHIMYDHLSLIMFIKFRTFYNEWLN